MPADQQDQMAPCADTPHCACLHIQRNTSRSSEWHVCPSLPVICVFFFPLPLTLAVKDLTQSWLALHPQRWQLILLSRRREAERKSGRREGPGRSRRLHIHDVDHQPPSSGIAVDTPCVLRTSVLTAQPKIR